MKKNIICILSVLTAALLAGRTSCNAQEISAAAADTLSSVINAAQEKTPEDWLKSKLDSLRLSSPQTGLGQNFIEEADSTHLQRIFVAPADSLPSHNGHDGYAEKLSGVRALQDSVQVFRKKLESMQRRLDEALEEIQRIELKFLTGE